MLAPATPIGIRVRDHTHPVNAAFLRDFAADVDPVTARALYAVQGRGAETGFAERVTQAAWHTKPCFYQVSTQDRTINPVLEQRVRIWNLLDGLPESPPTAC